MTDHIQLAPRMALVASRHGWKHIQRSWMYKGDISRSLCAVSRREVDAGMYKKVPCRQISTAALSLRIYSSEDCPLCDGLKEKLEALRERAQFQPDMWANMQVEVRPNQAPTLYRQGTASLDRLFVQAIDVDADQHLKDKYRMRIPVLEFDAGGEWKELPFQSPRLTADALGKRLEKHITEARQERA